MSDLEKSLIHMFKRKSSIPLSVEWIAMSMIQHVAITNTPKKPSRCDMSPKIVVFSCNGTKDDP